MVTMRVVVATLDFSGRDDLIKEDAKMDNYFRDSDLRSLPDVHNVYGNLPEGYE